jgi:hypothetical protein
MVRRLAFLTAAALFFAALFFATGREALVECDVCLEFDGRTACRTGSAADRIGAQRGAVSAACAVLAAGVTRRMECDRTPPRSVQCSQ